MMPKFDTKQIDDMVMAALRKLGSGSFWQHYKGGVYRVEDVVMLTATDEVGVVYIRVDGPGFERGREGRIQFARPYSEWFDQIDNAREEPVQRFTRVDKVQRWEAIPEPKEEE